MNKLRWRHTFVALVALACGMKLAACQLDVIRADEQQTSSESLPANPRAEQGLVIENDSALPNGYPHRHYELRFRVRGGVSALHWKVEKGALPPGMQLDDSGLLRGEPIRAGEFQFTVSVTESGRTEPAVQKGFVLKVLAALALSWKDPAHVAGNRIEGSVEVTNTTPDDMDLTFIVLAVAQNGRATAIGYQHFMLRGGTIAKELPFGDTLPHGGYVVHVDAVGEVEPKKLIYRERIQIPGALQVTVGP
jgi:hypothetical protein